MVRAPNAKSSSAFHGPDSLRVRAEWSILLWSLAVIAIAAPLLAFFFPVLASFKEIALLLIGAMIYVTFARGRLIGGSIRVHPGQFGHVYDIALECSRALQMHVPHVFVRDDPFVPMVAVGIGEPYSLIISAQWVAHLTPGELRFLIGRELAHIQAGHARITSLLSVNGRENAVVSILFGAWLRRIEYTADRAGLLCCGSLDEAISAIAVSTFHLVGRTIDLAAFAEQQRELEAERALRIGEWVSAAPYATKRIAALRSFARDALFLQWSARFEHSRCTPYVSPPLPAGAISKRAYANFPRRCAALFIDAVVITAIVPAISVADIAGRLHRSAEVIPPQVAALTNGGSLGRLVDQLSGSLDMVSFCVYVVALVGLTGQTLGMMIMDLRVVNQEFGRVGFARTLWRYLCLAGSLACLVGFVQVFRRIQPFERWSHTRLIDGGAFARSRQSVTAPQFEAASR